MKEDYLAIDDNGKPITLEKENVFTIEIKDNQWTIEIQDISSEKPTLNEALIFITDALKELTKRLRCRNDDSS